ncbi:hypothetical protein TNCT_699141 [Trichonephila clavata]|uniref:Uncharacterized protein n=1 Tax=Trichonephila clavata TaxID=2740835 RepID=A0A8X6FYI1_TRICU|nr:hypothetical protein TNCT_699141 [Trichonephila clavata]
MSLSFLPHQGTMVTALIVCTDADAILLSVLATCSSFCSSLRKRDVSIHARNDGKILHCVLYIPTGFIGENQEIPGWPRSCRG